MKRIRRVLHATDFSRASGRAFTTAVDLAKRLHAPLTVVHVIPPPLPMAPEQYVDYSVFDRIEAQSRQWAAHRLERLAERASRAGARVRTALREGDPASQIVRAAKTDRADLIVVGSHGRGALPKLLLGSVAERVVRTAACPVVTVRGT